MPKTCAYCGSAASTVDHVVPKGLYPKSRRTNKIRLLTVPACRKCNESYSDDEEHFRNVITCAGKNTPAVNELFYNKVNRSFVEGKSLRHFRQLIDLMREDEGLGEKRHIIYPMEDDRFVRILKKIFRGLAFYHFDCSVPEENVWIDVLRYPVPRGLLENVRWCNYEEDIFGYFYEVYKMGESYKSCWLVQIFKSRKFLGVIDMTEDMNFDEVDGVRLW